jgi:hypothetical protein
MDSAADVRRILLPAAVSLVPEAAQLDLIPAFAFLRLGPPITRRGLTYLEPSDLPHVEQQEGIRLPSGGHCYDAAALVGLDEPRRMPTGRELRSHYPHAYVERNGSCKNGPRGC